MGKSLINRRPPLLRTGIDAQDRLLELRLTLVQSLKLARRKSGLSQEALADRIGSSQSRVAKAEAADPSVSFDLIIRAAVAVGMSAKDISRSLGELPD